jgi:hypothetical protein
VKVIDDIFSEEELNLIHADFNSLIDTSDPLKPNNKNQWRTNRYAWQPTLYAGTTGHVLSNAVSNEVRPILLEKIQQYSKPNPLEQKFDYYIWEAGSGINLHSDESYSCAFTFYLQDWPIEWGGQLFAKIDGKACIIPAKYNRMVVNDDETPHWVTPVRNIKDYSRHTIQVFVR